MKDPLTYFYNYSIKAIEPIYKKSGINKPFIIYVKDLKKEPLIAFIVSFILFTLLHTLFLNIKILYSMLLALPLSLIIGLITFAGIFYYPKLKASSRATNIDSSLIYTVGFMAVLAVSGMNTLDLIKETVKKENNKDIKEELLMILKDIYLVGVDTLDALKNGINRSPSIILGELLNSIREATLTRGNLSDILLFFSTRLLEDKRRKLRSIINSLGFISEIYVTAMVAGPIIFTIMFSIMSFLGGNILGLHPLLLMILLNFILIPFSAVALILMVDAWLSKV